MTTPIVLIVDDDEGIRALINRLCEREGYAALLARDAETALRLLEDTPFDVAIVDLFLPEPLGMDVLRRIKERRPSAEVIILTGYGDLSTAVEALRLGAADYLQKPIQDLALIPVSINRALDRQALYRRNAELLNELRQANREVAQRRDQQLRYIRHIGQALAGALDLAELARVLVQAILGSIDCDAAGVLFLAGENDLSPMAMLGGRRKLAPTACMALLDAMMAQLPGALEINVNSVRTHVLWTEHGADAVDVNDSDGASWTTHTYADLVSRESQLGMVMIAWHDDVSLGEEERGIFDVLASQGSSALENVHLFSRMRELATRDSLTGLYNHRHFFELLDAEISRSERYGLELAIIMLDLDRAHGLKAINDTYGHQSGDKLLCDVAASLRAMVRRADAIARYGGDEFIIMAPQTDAGQALVLAQRICAQLREKPFFVHGNEEHITVSVGVSAFSASASQTGSGLVGLADQALYAAKDQGGDRVCVGSPADGVPQTRPASVP